MDERHGSARDRAARAANPAVGTLDLTGGAPELNPNFRWLVREARALGRAVIDRCNLTVLFEPGQEDTAEFLAAHGGAGGRVAALLHARERRRAARQARVRAQHRGAAPAQRSSAMRSPGSGLELDLVYNPLGPSLPPDQAQLEADLSRASCARTSASSSTGSPRSRTCRSSASRTRSSATVAHAEYMGLLVNHFNPDTVPALMCRSLVSVGWDGAALRLRLQPDARAAARRRRRARSGSSSDSASSKAADRDRRALLRLHGRERLELRRRAHLTTPSTASRRAALVAIGVARSRGWSRCGSAARAELCRAFARWVESLGFWGPAVFIAGYALAVVAFVPASLLTLAARRDLRRGEGHGLRVLRRGAGLLARVPGLALPRARRDRAPARGQREVRRDRPRDRRAGPQDRVPAAALARRSRSTC